MPTTEHSEAEKPLRGSMGLLRGVHAHVFVVRPDPDLPPKPILDQKVSLSLLCHFSPVISAAYGAEPAPRSPPLVTKTIVLGSQFQERPLAHLLNFMKSCCLPTATEANQRLIESLGMMDCFHLSRAAHLLGVKGVSSLTKARMEDLSVQHLSATDVQSAFLVPSDTNIDEQWQRIAREALERGGTWQGMDAAWIIKIEPGLRSMVESKLTVLKQGKDKRRVEDEERQATQGEVTDLSATGNPSSPAVDGPDFLANSKGSESSPSEPRKGLDSKDPGEDSSGTQRDSLNPDEVRIQPVPNDDQTQNLPYKFYDSGGKRLGGDNSGLSNDYLNSLCRPMPVPVEPQRQTYKERSARSTGRRLGDDDGPASSRVDDDGDMGVERRKGKRLTEDVDGGSRSEESTEEKMYKERYGERGRGGRILGDSTGEDFSG